jgi:hypothetical protein
MKAKVKKIKVSAASDRDISDMFNQMLGTGSVNLSIAYPRYIKIKELSLRVMKVFNLLANSPMMTSKEDTKNGILKYCDLSHNNINALFTSNLDKYTLDFSATPKELADEFGATYEVVKKSPFIKSLITIADKLHPYKDNFAKMDKLNHKFVYDISGVDWSPFPFPFNIKDLFLEEYISKNTIEFIMVILNKLYLFTIEIYNTVRTPDIDVDQFIEIITSSIAEIQKRPELNRCSKAFNKIKESVMLLKTNFNDYYRDFVETQDNTIIMQNFILDVSKNTKADLELTRQFRKIIAFYREQAQKNGGENSEKINMIFDKINETFKDYDVGLQNIGIKKEEKEEKAEEKEEESCDSST